MSKANFETALAFVLKHEGGYVNDPQDPGGETKYGISKRAYPNLDIKGLTEDGAKAIYRRDYWDRSGSEALGALGLIHFDTAVNMGVGMAKALFQAASGLEDYALLRIERYLAIVKAKPAQAKYLHGWVRRTVEAARASRAG